MSTAQDNRETDPHYLRVLKFLGWALLAVISAFLFLWSLSWDASALSKPLAETSMASLIDAALIWIARIVFAMWAVAAGMMALNGLVE